MANNAKNAIVITSIFPPTEAVNSFSKLEEYQLIVVGDKKTPTDWHCEGTTYLSIEDQQSSKFKLAEVLPYNHYCRKMLGYLHAMELGVSQMVDTDDDNIPKENWVFPEFEGNFDAIQEEGFVNIYQLYTSAKVWPRGLPLRFINTDFQLEEKLKKETQKVGVWQGLADEDPDVDAIYRLTNDTPCYFEDRPPVVLSKGALTPFNTQNTVIRKELFPLMYLPTYVTFRFTDILRGLVAQPIMWLYDFHLGFTNATVLQKRNPHDYMKDFISEIPMYEQTEKVIELVSSVISADESIENNLFNAYQELHAEAIVEDREMETLEAWLEDLSNLSKISNS